MFYFCPLIVRPLEAVLRSTHCGQLRGHRGAVCLCIFPVYSLPDDLFQQYTHMIPHIVEFVKRQFYCTLLAIQIVLVDTIHLLYLA